MRGRFPWKLRNKDWYRLELVDSSLKKANSFSRYYTKPVNEDGSAMIGAKNKLVLPDKQKHDFASKHLLCVEYMDLTQTQEIELFQRVQLGKPLTKAETFKASQGMWQDLGRKFEEEYADILLREYEAEVFCYQADKFQCRDRIIVPPNFGWFCHAFLRSMSACIRVHQTAFLN